MRYLGFGSAFEVRLVAQHNTLMQCWQNHHHIDVSRRSSDVRHAYDTVHTLTGPDPGADQPATPRLPAPSPMPTRYAAASPGPSSSSTAAAQARGPGRARGGMAACPVPSPGAPHAPSPGCSPACGSPGLPRRPARLPACTSHRGAAASTRQPRKTTKTKKSGVLLQRRSRGSQPPGTCCHVAARAHFAREPPAVPYPKYGGSRAARAKTCTCGPHGPVTPPPPSPAI